jgi:3-methyladenine DNA glycosylase Tag
MPTQFQSEIVVAESNAVSNKLMEMFEQLAGKPTKETYEQATAMVSWLIKFCRLRLKK